MGLLKHNGRRAHCRAVRRSRIGLSDDHVEKGELGVVLCWREGRRLIWWYKLAPVDEPSFVGGRVGDHPAADIEIFGRK